MLMGDYFPAMDFQFRGLSPVKRTIVHYQRKEFNQVSQTEGDEEQGDDTEGFIRQNSQQP